MYVFWQAIRGRRVKKRVAKFGVVRFLEAMRDKKGGRRLNKCKIIIDVRRTWVCLRRKMVKIDILETSQVDKNLQI